MATLDLEKFKIKKPSFFSRFKEAIPFTEEAKQFRQRKEQERLRLPERRKALGDFLRKSFVEPAKVRPLLSAKEETLPFGGKVIGGTLSLGQRIIEDSIIGGLKIASTLKSNRQQARGEIPTPIKLPVDVTFQKLFSDDLTTTREFKSMLDEAYTEIDRLDKERPDKPTLNLLQGATQEIFMPILDAVDIIGVSELATRGARQLFTSKEAKTALKRLGISAFGDASEAGIKNQTKRKFHDVFKQVEKGKITEELATKKLNEIGQALDTLSTTKQSRFGKLGEEVRKVANILTEERPVMESLRALKESASAGLSIRRVDDIPDDLAAEARKYKSAEEFVRETTKQQKQIVEDLIKKSDAAFAKSNEITGGKGTVENARNIKIGQELKAKAIKEERKLLNKLSASQLTDIWKRANIDERLAPLADKDGMVTVYRASAKFPKDKLPKDTFVATDPNNARYYAESHYKGEPSDITIRSFKIPATELKRGGSSDAWQLKNDFSLTDIWERATKEVPTSRPIEDIPQTKQVSRAADEPLLQEARKYKSAEEFVKAQGMRENLLQNKLTSQSDVNVLHGTPYWEDIISGGKGIRSGIRRNTPSAGVPGGISVADNPSRAFQFSQDQNVAFKLETKFGDILPDKDTIKNIRSVGQKIGNTTRDSLLQGDAAFLKNDTFGIKSVLVKTPSGEIVELPYKSGSKELIAQIKQLQTKSQLTDIWERANKVTKEAEPTLKPAVIQGETFTLGQQGLTQPTKKEARTALRQEIKATKKEIANAKKAQEKALKLEAKQQKTRTEAMENIQRFRGSTDQIIESLKSRHLSDEDIANIVLEDGTKLIDTVRVKRNADGSLATVIRKSDIEELKTSYTDEIPKQNWERRSILVEGIEVPLKLARSIELPYAWFGRKGLNQIYDPIIQAGRDAETMKSMFLQRFKDAGLFKEGGWFTADRFTLSKRESQNVGKYFLSRQDKGFKMTLEQLSPRERKFVEIFDGIIAETEPRFFETAKLNGKTPGRVENYAPIMTSKDFKLIDQGGTMDWLFRNHPSFFSLKERAKRVPPELYELDYRQVASRWIDGITEFLTIGETSAKQKYLINSDEFKGIVKEQDQQFVSNWLKDITTPNIPTSEGAQALNWLSRLLRKGVAVGALGLNYASVAKQALTQIPILIINKAPPKLHSKYARAFGIDVSQLPSITKRKGDIAIQDLQGRIGRIFTGALTQFDKKNAQISLNALLDKEFNKFLKEGTEITPEVQKLIEKRAQDALDMWYGGFFKGQRPEAFRKELGNFILMFLYPLTSQLNGFVRHVLTAQGASKIKAGAEVIVAATIIAYMEQVIENLSPQWSDEGQMTKDVLQSMAGNIPMLGNIVYSISNETELQISPVLGNVSNLVRQISKGDKERVAWTIAETFGTPRQIRKIKEGMDIMEAGGITNDEGKMLAPVSDTMELVRTFLRGKYGSMASQDWIRNIGEKSEDRRWFVPQVEFLQNGDYDRKAELYRQFPLEEKLLLRSFLSEGQQKRLDSALKNPSKKIDLDKFKINLEEFKLKQPQE